MACLGSMAKGGAVKDVIVVSYATHRAGLLDEYEAQLAAAGIEFHMEPVELPDGINSVTARWKFEFMRRMCERFSDYLRIVFTDAWDILFFGTKAEVIGKPVRFMISGERNCWPEVDMEDRFTFDSPWRFCNAGVIFGSPYGVIDWCDDALKYGDIHLLEQTWLNRHKAANDISIPINTSTSMSYVVSRDKEDGSLRINDGRLYNSLYGTYPQFFHFSGKCPTEPFRRMLETGEPLCASV